MDALHIALHLLRRQQQDSPPASGDNGVNGGGNAGGDTTGGGNGGGGGGSSTGDKFLDLIAQPFQSELYADSVLAALGVSIIITLSMFLLFCCLRPHNTIIYAPRAKHADSKHALPSIPTGLFGWIKTVATTKEETMIEKAGLDAALFLRFTRMLRNIFICLSFIGCGILIPLNILSSNSKGSNAFMRMTPLFINNRTSFWAYVLCAYLFDIIICYFLWRNYRVIVRLRRQYFDSSAYQRSLHSRTLLVTDVPKEMRTDEGLLRLTEEVQATADAPRTAIARNVKDLPDLVEEHEETVRKLEGFLAKYLKNPNALPAQRPTCTVNEKDKAYTKGQKVDAIEYLTSRIKELEIEIKEVRESVDKRNSMSFGFASYESITAAHTVAYTARKGGPQGSDFRLAPSPNNLIWKNLKLVQKERKWLNFINNVWIVALTIVWIGPNVLIAVFLSNLSHIGQLWPEFNQSLQAHRQWWAIVQGVASPAITMLFYYFLPRIFRKLRIRAGDQSKTSRERNVLDKLYAFMVFNNFIVFSLFAAIFGFVTAVVGAAEDEDAWSAIKDGNIFGEIVRTLCTVSPFWASWLLQRNMGAAVDLSQLVNMFLSYFKRKFMSPTPRELIELTAPAAFTYAEYYNYFLYYSTVAIAFATIQPIVLPIAAFYFWIDSHLKKYLLMYVLITKYESAGSYWIFLFNRCIFFTIFGNVIIALFVGTLGAQRWAMLGCMAPLPFLVAGFKWYCMRTFDDNIHYFATGNRLSDDQVTVERSEHKARKGDRVGVRFGHPALYKPLMTPMVSAKSEHLLKTIYCGRTSLDQTADIAGFSDVYMDTMDHAKPGKTAGGKPGNAPFEVVNENEMDFEYWKDRPEFAEEAGGDGQLYGRAPDIMRPGTPGSTMAGGLSRAGTATTWDSPSNSREHSADSERTRVPSGNAYHGRGLSGSRSASREDMLQGDGVDYPRGYHQTPSALREQSPAGSEVSLDIGGRGGADAHTLRSEVSREGLVSNASRMGRSPLPRRVPIPAPTPGGYGPVRAPGETPGSDREEDTSYDYFRRGRGVS
ncbi:hypothetical protein MBLNU230_g2008t1 [Neophaeotheca triangularis]